MAEVVLPSSLQERIAQAQPQLATLDDLPESVMLRDDGKGERVDLADGAQPETGQETPSMRPVDTPTQPTTPAGSPQYDPALIQQIAQRAQSLEAENQRLQVERQVAALQADEQRFADSIAHLPAWQQEQLLHERERGQAQTINVHLQNQLMQLHDQIQGRDQQSHEQREMVAKRMIAYTKASQAGLDFSNPVVFAQLTGNHITKPEQMDEAVRGLLQLAGNGGGQRPIVAGGARSTNAGPPAPKQGSGDLAGLINSRSYELVPAE